MWQTFQADRFNKLKMGIRVLGNDPYFKAVLETDAATILDTLRERNQELKADFFIVTGPDGVVLARTDRPGARGENLAQDPIAQKPLEGEESATVWKQGERLFHAVSVPMVTDAELKGVLIAGYSINEALAGDIRKLTHSEIAYLTHQQGQPPLLSVSSLGPREAELRAALGRPEMAAAAAAGTMERFDVDLGGDSYAGDAGAAHRRHRADRRLRARPPQHGRGDGRLPPLPQSLIVVSLVVMVLALGVAYVVGSRITGPVRTLADMVERARNGSYAGKVQVDSRDEIGDLARTFNSLLADLREKEHMIGFLREGMTMMKKGGPVADRVTAPANPQAATTLGGAGDTITIGGPTEIHGDTGRPGAASSRTATRCWARWARAAWAWCTAPATSPSTTSSP